MHIHTHTILNVLRIFLQLVDIFGGLLDRPIIKEIFDPYYPKLVEYTNRELDVVKVIYDVQMQAMLSEFGAPVHRNLPKVVPLAITMSYNVMVYCNRDYVYCNCDYVCCNCILLLCIYCVL